MSGITTDGKRVLGGLFPLVNSEGIPLDVLLTCLHQNNDVPDWVDFINEAIRTDWNLDSLLTRINQSVSDTYGPEFRDHVMKKLKLLYKQV